MTCIALSLKSFIKFIIIINKSMDFIVLEIYYVQIITTKKYMYIYNIFTIKYKI